MPSISLCTTNLLQWGDGDILFFHDRNFRLVSRNSGDERIHLALVKLLGEMDQLPEF